MVTFGPGGMVGSILSDSILSDSILSGAALHDRQHARDVGSSGFASLDALLPAGGVRRGSLIELVSGDAGGGAATLACAVACRLAAPRGPDAAGTIVIVDRRGWFHPPAVLPWRAVPGHEETAVRCGGAGHRDGGPRLIVVRPSHDDDELWAIDQALRCPGVTAVVAWPQAVIPGEGVIPGAGVPRRAQRGNVTMRRWQLAARASGAVGLIMRPLASLIGPCWAEARITVAPLPSGRNEGSLLVRRLRLERVGGTWCGGRTGLAQAGAPQVCEIMFDLARGCEQPAEAVSSRRAGSFGRVGSFRNAGEVWRVAE